MAAKKKAAPRSHIKQTVGRSSRLAAAPPVSRRVRLLTVCFTLLSIVFAVTSFYRYR